ncbi:MAG: hypothetical protein ACRDCW_14875, partial [Sarcina sp.]
VGANVLGLISGVLLLKKGYFVNIYEKREYIGGTLNSFNGVKLSKPQLFNYLVLDKNEDYIFKKKFNFFNYDKLQVYKKIKFNEAMSVDIKFGIDEIENLFLKYIDTQEDKIFVETLLKDIREIHRAESLIKTYKRNKFLNIDKWLWERNLNNLKGKYKNIKVEDIIDKISNKCLREIIKSLANVKCSSCVFIEVLKYICFYNIYNLENVFEVLNNEFLRLGGEIHLLSEVSSIESKESKGIIKINNEIIESDYVICTVNNFYSLKKIFDEEFLEKDFHKSLHSGELFDSYVIINLYFKDNYKLNTNVCRYILDRPFIDNTGSFHRKFEFYFDDNKKIASLYIRGNYHFWEHLNDQRSNQVGYSKFILAQKFLEELKKCNSEINDNYINKVEVITPYDFKKANDCIRGSSRGIIPTPKFYNKVIKYKNDMQRCYFTREELGCGMYLNSKFKDSIRIVDKILLE